MTTLNTPLLFDDHKGSVELTYDEDKRNFHAHIVSDGRSITLGDYEVRVLAQMIEQMKARVNKS